MILLTPKTEEDELLYIDNRISGLSFGYYSIDIVAEFKTTVVNIHQI